MATKRDELLDHAYDGIREYNNPLPKWWLWLFYATIVFAAFYVTWFWLGYAASGPEEYKQEMAEARRLHPEAAEGAREHVEEKGEVHVAAPAGAGPAWDHETLEAGRAVFAQNCSPCHGAQGQGLIGPNLTDNYWLHGNSYAAIVETITNGVPDKGMISWKSTLGPQKIKQVASYVASLKGTHPPNPKAPQGQLYKD